MAGLFPGFSFSSLGWESASGRRTLDPSSPVSRRDDSGKAGAIGRGFLWHPTAWRDRKDWSGVEPRDSMWSPEYCHAPLIGDQWPADDSTRSCCPKELSENNLDKSITKI